MHRQHAVSARVGRTGITGMPRVVLVRRPSEYEWLLRRHSTAQQASFFLEQRGQSVAQVLARHERQEAALQTALDAIPYDWRRVQVTRSDLSRFLFEPQDIVVIVGRDGLVANVAKYLEGQYVIGLNPDRSRNEGVLVHHAPGDAAMLLRAAASAHPDVEVRAMAEARTDDGRTLVALNEIFVGHQSHQSARYEIALDGADEAHSSSGIIVTTGTGSSGWARSIARSRRTGITLPRPTEHRLAFFVREAWPSVATRADLVEGELVAEENLAITSRMERGGVVFGDGIESDRLDLPWGQSVRIGVSKRQLLLLR